MKQQKYMHDLNSDFILCIALYKNICNTAMFTQQTHDYDLIPNTIS